MAKISYENIERAVIRSMRVWSADRIRKMTHETADESLGPSNKKRAVSERLGFLKELKADLDRVYVRNKSIYRELGFPYRHFKFAIAMYDRLNDDQWGKVEKLRDRLDQHVKENPFTTEDGIPETEEQSIVESERAKHKTMRHNVKSDWLPS